MYIRLFAGMVPFAYLAFGFTYLYARTGNPHAASALQFLGFGWTLS